MLPQHLANHHQVSRLTDVNLTYLMSSDKREVYNGR